MKMKKRVKKEWVKALRSGDYRQGTGKLKFTTDEEGDLYCCLGVLRDLYRKEHKGISWSTTEDAFCPRFLSHDTDLPGKVVDWAGLSSGNPQIGKGSAVSINDEKKGKKIVNDFNEIAGLIDKNL